MKFLLKLQILLPHTSKIVYNKVMIIKKKIIQRQGDSVENSSETEISEENVSIEEPKDEEIDIFNLDNIDFKQRNERRRGDRRRGFRRIDDRNLISRAREEAQSIKEASQKEGYQEGLNQAKADIEEMRDTLTAFMGAKQEVFDTVAPYVMEMSLDIAKKIIKKEIQQDPSIILDNIQELLRTLSKEESKITLKVNPIQVSLVKSEVPEMLTNVGLEAKLMVVPDDSIMEGGCLVETTNGVIDATIETQLSVISEALKEV